MFEEGRGRQDFSVLECATCRAVKGDSKTLGMSKWKNGVLATEVGKVPVENLWGAGREGELFHFRRFHFQVSAR